MAGLQRSMESLPTDIVLELLSRVPAESVLECKLVCKRWGTLTRGSNFVKMHLRRQLNYLHGGSDTDDDNLSAKVEPCLFFACRIVDPDEFITFLFHGGQLTDRISMDERYIYNQNLKRIHHPPMHDDPLVDHLVGSCNGLVCAFQRHHLVIDPIYICNPLTREYVRLPELVLKKEDVNPSRIVGGEVNMIDYTACGFGYVRSTNEHKVVRIYYLGNEEGNAEVYSLGSGCGWRAIGIVPYYLLGTSSGGKGTYANDDIYWITQDKQVVAFDLANEEFRLLSAPPCMQNRKPTELCGLVTLGRHLCLYVDKQSLMEIWLLKKRSNTKKNSKKTWRMGFGINYKAVVGYRGKRFQPILLTKKGKIIFLYAKSVLYSYDPKTTSLKTVSNKASADNFEAVEVIAHINSFASLKDMGENSKRYTVGPHQVGTSWDDVTNKLHQVTLGEEIGTTSSNSADHLPI